MIRTIVLLAIIFVLGTLARADDSPARTSDDEKEIQLKARKRIYPGGRDEEPLKVQTQLPQSVRKLNETDETASEPTSDD